jgi:transglutaminase-like putative cysteine protease
MPVKRKVWFIGILILCMLNLSVGCGTDSADEVPSEPVTFTYDPEETQLSEQASLIEKYGLDILPVISVEAGTECLTAEMFFDSYSGQELDIGQELSAEELSVCGATYPVPVTYKGYDLEIEVDVVDTTAPEIVKLDDILVKVGDTVAYKKAVEYSDNSSNALTLAIDNSAVDLQTPGEYSVIYTVTDAGGNSSQAVVTLTVLEATSHTEEDVKDLAMAVLGEVYDPDASAYDNALALFKWVHSNIRYTHSSGDRSSVWAGAYEGLHDGSGDCYAFYATYAVLLTYAGIDNACVARVSDSSNHWWNLVNTGDGWYHCDTSPRRNGDGYFCFMQTDAQVAAYTRAYPEKPDYYTFDSSLIPERATTIIYGYDPDTIYEKYNTEAVNRRLAEKDATEDADDTTDQAEQFIDEDEEIEEVEEENVDTAVEEEEAATDKTSDKKKKKKKKTEQASETETGGEAEQTTETETSEETEQIPETGNGTDTEQTPEPEAGAEAGQPAETDTVAEPETGTEAVQGLEAESAVEGTAE